MGEELRKVLLDIIKEQEEKREKIESIKRRLPGIETREAAAVDKFEKGFTSDVESGIYPNMTDSQFAKELENGKNDIRARFQEERTTLEGQMAELSKVDENEVEAQYSKIATELAKYQEEMTAEQANLKNQEIKLIEQKTAEMNLVNNEIEEKQTRIRRLVMQNRNTLDLYNNATAEITSLTREVDILKSQLIEIFAKYDPQLDSLKEQIGAYDAKLETMGQFLGDADLKSKSPEEIYRAIFEDEKERAQGEAEPETPVPGQGEATQPAPEKGEEEGEPAPAPAPAPERGEGEPEPAPAPAPAPERGEGEPEPAPAPVPERGEGEPEPAPTPERPKPEGPIAAIKYTALDSTYEVTFANGAKKIFDTERGAVRDFRKADKKFLRDVLKGINPGRYKKCDIGLFKILREMDREQGTENFEEYVKILNGEESAISLTYDANKMLDPAAFQGQNDETKRIMTRVLKRARHNEGIEVYGYKRDWRDRIKDFFLGNPEPERITDGQEPERAEEEGHQAPVQPTEEQERNPEQETPIRPTRVEEHDGIPTEEMPEQETPEQDTPIRPTTVREYEMTPEQTAKVEEALKRSRRSEKGQAFARQLQESAGQEEQKGPEASTDDIVEEKPKDSKGREPADD